jgi:hypothetical protein
MNLNYGYQVYQAERTMTRQETIAGDARRGQQAAAAARACRGLAQRARRSRTIVTNACARLAAKAARVQTEEM